MQMRKTQGFKRRGGGEGGSGSCSPGKILKFEKYIEIVNPTITTLFCIILNFLQSHQVDLFGSWAEVCAHPRHPIAYRPGILQFVCEC